MEGIFRKAIFREPELENDLLTSIRDICRRLELADARFEMESDDDLIEACIYEREALRARYRYLLRRAKEQGVKSCNI